MHTNPASVSIARTRKAWCDVGDEGGGGAENAPPSICSRPFIAATCRPADLGKQMDSPSAAPAANECDCVVPRRPPFSRTRLRMPWPRTCHEAAVDQLDRRKVEAGRGPVAHTAGDERAHAGPRHGRDGRGGRNGYNAPHAHGTGPGHRTSARGRRRGRPRLWQNAAVLDRRGAVTETERPLLRRLRLRARRRRLRCLLGGRGACHRRARGRGRHRRAEGGASAIPVQGQQGLRRRRAHGRAHRWRADRGTACGLASGEDEGRALLVRKLAVGIVDDLHHELVLAAHVLVVGRARRIRLLAVEGLFEPALGFVFRHRPRRFNRLGRLGRLGRLRSCHSGKPSG